MEGKNTNQKKRKRKKESKVIVNVNECVYAMYLENALRVSEVRVSLI